MTNDRLPKKGDLTSAMHAADSKNNERKTMKGIQEQRQAKGREDKAPDNEGEM